jgi:hypothetical protein
VKLSNAPAHGVAGSKNWVRHGLRVAGVVERSIRATCSRGWPPIAMKFPVISMRVPAGLTSILITLPTPPL